MILLKGRVRIEGFHYPPVLEFDEFLTYKDGLKDEARQAISSDIAQSRHYENKVAPLYMSGDEKSVRVLVQLLRDEATSYDGDYGEPVATVRHEVWQYSHNYGAWTKEKRTRVLDRILTAKRELHQWTWVWVPQLGGITVGPDDVIVRYCAARDVARAPCHRPAPVRFLRESVEQSSAGGGKLRPLAAVGRGFLGTSASRGSSNRRDRRI